MGGFTPNLDYLAGFFDGEGCICIALHKAKKYTYGCHWISIQASNLDKRPLVLFEKEFGGNVRWVKRADIKKAGWVWSSNATKNWKFAEKLSGRIFIKHPVLEAAISYRKRVMDMRLPRAERKMTKKEFLEREKIRKFVSDYNRKRITGNFPKKFVFTPAYLAGLFDAEGSVGIRKLDHARTYTLSSQIASTCFPLLELLKERFGGYIDYNTGKFVACAKTGEIFLRFLQPYLIVKKRVVREALKIRNLNSNIGYNKINRNVVRMRKLKESVQKLNRRAA